MSSNLHIGNLGDDTTPADLETLFRKHGGVEGAQVVTDVHSGRSRGFGYVTMESAEDAVAAIGVLHGYSFAGRILTVAIAKPRTP